LIVNFAGNDYDISNNIISLGPVSFDVSKCSEFPNGKPDNEGELARLYLDLLPLPERTVTNFKGDNVTLPAKKGINIVTATFTAMKNYLNDDTIKKSDSIKSLCRRVMFLRFPVPFNTEMNNVTSKIIDEYVLIEKDTRKNIEFLGEVGFNNTVHLSRARNHKTRVLS